MTDHGKRGLRVPPWNYPTVIAATPARNRAALASHLYGLPVNMEWPDCHLMFDSMWDLARHSVNSVEFLIALYELYGTHGLIAWDGPTRTIVLSGSPAQLATSLAGDPHYTNLLWRAADLNPVEGTQWTTSTTSTAPRPSPHRHDPMGARNRRRPQAG